MQEKENLTPPQYKGLFRNWLSLIGVVISTGSVFSCLFLVTYITNHALHGDMRFQGAGVIRYVYFPLLISHIGLSVVALPMILVTFFLSLTGRFPAHRRLARFTFPVWLYVSVTGVIVYAMLAACR